MDMTIAKSACASQKRIPIREMSSRGKWSNAASRMKKCAYCSCDSPVWRDSFCLYHYQEEYYNSR